MWMHPVCTRSVHCLFRSGQHTGFIQNVHHRGLTSSLWVYSGWPERLKKPHWEPLSYGVLGHVVRGARSMSRSTKPNTQRSQQRWRRASALANEDYSILSIWQMGSWSSWKSDWCPVWSVWPWPLKATNAWTKSWVAQVQDGDWPLKAKPELKMKEFSKQYAGRPSGSHHRQLSGDV